MKKFKTKRIVLFKTKLIAKAKDVSNYSSESKKVLFTSKQNQISNTIPTQFLKKKKYRFTIETNPEKKILKEGKWSIKENIQFFEALDRYGVNWEKITDSIPTRTANQIRAHTQKFFIKLKRYKDDKLGIDLTLSSIHNIQDAINHIKSKNINYSLSDILLHVLGNRKKRVKKFENIESTKNKKVLNLQSNNDNINNYIYNNNFNNFQINNNIVLNTIMNNDSSIVNFIYNNLKNSIINDFFNNVNNYILSNYLNYLYYSLDIYNNIFPFRNFFDSNLYNNDDNK